MLKPLSLWPVLLLCMHPDAEAQASPKPQFETASEEPTKRRLIELQRAWHWGYVTGDEASLERMLADGFTVTNSAGLVLDRATTKTRYIRRRPGLKLEPSDEQVRLYDNAAVIISKQAEWVEGEWIDFRITDSFVRQNGEWRAASSQWTRLPARIEEMALTPAKLARFAGTYVAANGQQTLAKVTGSRLVLTRAGAAGESVLVPVAETTFVSQQSGNRFLFVSDASGAIVSAVVRTNRDLDEWKRR